MIHQEGEGVGVPLAMAAVHQTTNRFIPSASAMLPVQRGFVFLAAPEVLSADPGHKGAAVEAYWNPASPRCVIMPRAFGSALRADR